MISEQIIKQNSPDELLDKDEDNSSIEKEPECDANRNCQESIEKNHPNDDKKILFIIASVILTISFINMIVNLIYIPRTFIGNLILVIIALITTILLVFGSEITFNKDDPYIDDEELYVLVQWI